MGRRGGCREDTEMTYVEGFVNSECIFRIFVRSRVFFLPLFLAASLKYTQALLGEDELQEVLKMNTEHRCFFPPWVFLMQIQWLFLEMELFLPYCELLAALP